tara:strand:- start:304 stop:450 length:147 start_codon:yes stop_codon:yes gene_type:complete
MGAFISKNTKKLSKAFPKLFFLNHTKEILFFVLGLYWAAIIFTTFFKI